MLSCGETIVRWGLASANRELFSLLEWKKEKYNFTDGINSILFEYVSDVWIWKLKRKIEN